MTIIATQPQLRSRVEQVGSHRRTREENAGAWVHIYEKDLLHETPRSQDLRGILLLKYLALENPREINARSNGGKVSLCCWIRNSKTKEERSGGEYLCSRPGCDLTRCEICERCCIDGVQKCGVRAAGRIFVDII